MWSKTIFIVTITSSVIYLVEAQNRHSVTSSHFPSPQLQPVEPQTIESYVEPIQRVEITHVEVDIVLKVTTPPPHQVIDLKQPRTTTYFNHVPDDDTNNVNLQQNLNRRQEFNDRNRNHESDNNNNMHVLVREPVRPSELIQAWENQKIDQHNKFREPVRTSKVKEERQYGDANNRNQGFDREPERMLNHGNSFTFAQEQGTNDFERAQAYGETKNYNQGGSREPERMVYQSIGSNSETDRYLKQDQDLHLTQNREWPQSREITHESNNSNRELNRESVHPSQFKTERKYDEENKQQQNINRDHVSKFESDTSFNHATDYRNDQHEVVNQDMNMMEISELNPVRSQNNDILQKRVIANEKNNRREIVRVPVGTDEFNREREYAEKSKPKLNLNREIEIRDDRDSNFNRDTDYHTNHNEELNQDANLFEISNSNHRELVKEPARTSEFNIKREYERDNKPNENFYRETGKGGDRTSSFNRASDRRHEDLNAMETQQRNHDRSQNKEATRVSNSNRRDIVWEPIRTSEFNTKQEYEQQNIPKPSFNRKTEKVGDRDSDFSYEPDRRVTHHEILNQNLNVMETQKPNRERSQNSEIFHSGNIKNQKLFSDPVCTDSFIQNRDYERTNSNNEAKEREPERYIDTNYNRAPVVHNNRNEIYKQDIIMMETTERPRNRETPQSGSNKKHKLANEQISASGFKQESEEQTTYNYKESINRTPERKLNQATGFNSTPDRRVVKNEVLKQDIDKANQKSNRDLPKAKENAQKAKANQKTQLGKTRRLCERKYSEYIERIYRNDDETTADANDSEFDGRVLASPGEYPHMTALGFKRKDNSVDYKCGGSLISENFVITAAHCTNFTGEVPTLARIGDINLMKDEKQLEPQMYRIRKIYVHPEYDGVAHYNDIALLQLNASVEFTEFVRPIRLWSRADLPLSTAFAMGYGATSFARAPTQQLTDFNMTIIANDECNERLPQLEEVPHGIVESLICAEDLVMHRDTCQGDSGGPLQYNIRGRRRKNRIHYQLIGITSFGLLCRSPNPGVYTRIYSFLDWIESKVWID